MDGNYTNWLTHFSLQLHACNMHIVPSYDTICDELSDLKSTAHITQRAVHHTSKEVKVVYLDLYWVDEVFFTFPDEDLIQCAHFIHQARTGGGSVLVNCAKVSN